MFSSPDGTMFRFKNGKSLSHSIPILNREETIDEYLNNIKVNLLDKQKTIESLREKIDNFEKEAYATKEMQDMKKQRDTALADMWRGFPITEKESVAIRDWKKKHDTEVHGNPHGYHGCSGGGYTYMFYPTSIGTVGSCRCDICHQRSMTAACAHGSYDRNVYQAEMKERGGTFDFQTLD